MPLTRDIPKCLLVLGGRTLLERQLTLLADLGIEEVVVVTGHGADAVRAACAGRARCVHNPHFEVTNSLYSLALAEDAMPEGPMLLLNSDVLIHPTLVERLLADPSDNALLVDLESRLDDEAMKVSVTAGRLVAIDKRLDRSITDGENVGVVKFGREGRRALFRAARGLLSEGRLSAWAPAAYQEILAETPIAAIPTDGMPWIEIDFPEDLARAARDVVPRIDGVAGPGQARDRAGKGALRASAHMEARP
ncbi:MAG TPA: phosphocholine cytidylyltransferase family protein [Thermodesulfobacteriota bacterium]